MVQVMEKLIQIHPQVILASWLGFRSMFVVGPVERFRKAAKDPCDGKTCQWERSSLWTDLVRVFEHLLGLIVTII